MAQAAYPASLTRNTLTAPLGFSVPDMKPPAHYVRRLDVVAWFARRLNR